MMIHKAIEFAATKHDGQVRKGTTTPYIVHPMEVMYYLTISGADKTTIIAGLLHDIVEDTPTTIEEVEKEFGSDVAHLVMLETEDKSKSWLERKAENIKRIKNAPKNAQLICCADKLSNLKSIYFDQQTDQNIWVRFTGTKEQTKEYYRQMIDALSLLNDEYIYSRLKFYYSAVFGQEI